MIEDMNAAVGSHNVTSLENKINAQKLRMALFEKFVRSMYYINSFADFRYDTKIVSVIITL